MERSRLVRAIAVGVVAGAMSGLFGVGGGILIVPALVMVMGFEQRFAHGTSLAAVLPIAVSSMTSYATSGKIDVWVGVFLSIGAVAGAVIGTAILHRLPHDALALGFAMLLLATAVRMLTDQGDATGRADLTLLGAVALVAIGVTTGILAGLLGVGGGIVLVPAMIVGFGVPAAVAKGTSLLVIIPTSIMGTWRNRTKSNVDLRVAATVGLAGVVSAFAAGKVSVGLSERTSNLLFAVFLVAIAAKMLLQLRSERAAHRAAAAGNQTA
jgi:uncharacterized membrane protein YfcA